MKATAGPKGKATRLHSLIVRARGVCEHCGYVCPCPNRPASHTTECRLQCAHIISRRHANTRTDVANAFALCASCHRTFTDRPLDWVRWVDKRIGADTHEALDRRAKDTSGQRFDWTTEAARLAFLWIEVQEQGYARSPYGDVLTNGDNP